MRDDELLEAPTTGELIRLFFRVYDRLGFGFFESVYAKALACELEDVPISFEREVAVDVWYKARRIGHYRTDFLVRGRVALELKASETLSDANRKQLLNFLRCSRLEVGLLLHFGPRARFERIVYTNGRKPNLPSPEEDIG
jgi:GxxExxY protein